MAKSWAARLCRCPSKSFCCSVTSKYCLIIYSAAEFMLMKTETINRKIYAKPAIVVLMLGKQKLLVVDSDEYYYQGAPDD